MRSKPYECLWMDSSFFSETAAICSGDAKSIQKKHCHKIWNWIIHGVVFTIFYCYSCKKIRLRRRHDWKHAVLETCQYVYELWIHLKCFKFAPSFILNRFLTHFHFHLYQTLFVHVYFAISFATVTTFYTVITSLPFSFLPFLHNVACQTQWWVEDRLALELLMYAHLKRTMNFCRTLM